jgi:hypothetical protein
MSLPSGLERQQLDVIADDLRETFSERGHHVDVALDADDAFGSGQSRSSLMRDLVRDTVARKASQLGVGFEPVNGTGRELVGAHHRYRLLRAKRNAKAEIVIAVNTESSLRFEEEASLFPLQNWVFGWISDSDGLIGEVFAAEIIDIFIGRPGRLVLGVVLALGSSVDGGPFGGKFNASDEGLDLGGAESDGNEGEHGADEDGEDEGDEGDAHGLSA